MSGPVFTTASDYKHSELPQENSHKTQQTVTLLLSSSERAELGNNVNCTKTNCQTTQISQNTVHHHKFTFHYRRPFVFATKYFYEVSLHARNVVETLSADDAHTRGEVRPANARAASTTRPPPPTPRAGPLPDTNLSFIT